MKRNSHILREAKKDPSVQVSEYLDQLPEEMVDKLNARCAELLDNWGVEVDDTPIELMNQEMGDVRFLKFLKKTVPLVEPKPRDMGAHTFISHFFDPPFDIEEFIGKMAKEKGISFEQAEQEWNDSNMKKTHVGRYAHMLADDAANGRPPSKEGTNPKEVAIYTAIYDYAKELVAGADLVESEVLLHASSAYVGGKFDLLMKKGDEWILVDWKTEGDGSNLDDVSTGKMGIDELTKGMNNNYYNKYALQLNVYEWAAKDGGKIPKDAKVRKELHQFKYLSDGQPVRIKVVQVPDMQELVQKMVEKAIQDGTIKKKDLNNKPNEVNIKMKRKRINEGAREEWEDLKRHWTASSKPKGQREFDQAAEWNKAHPETTCDRCGFSSRNEDYFGIEGDEVLCDKCRRGMNESGSTIRKKIDGKTVKGWYEWLKEENMGCCHLSVGSTAEHDICICMGWHDDGEDGSIAWKIGQQSFRNAMQTDLDVDFDMPYDPETGDVYDTLSYLDDVDPETFDWDGLADEMNRTAQEVYEYACEVDGTDDDGLYEESWIGDKMKAGWNKVKSGAKKLGKAISDKMKGPFRKGDQIVMKGEDGEQFKGTIMDYDRSDRTYEVLLGKQVANEGLEEDVLDMPDRVDELESEIEKLWDELGDIGGKNEIVLDLISKYVELEKIEPGRVDFDESTMVNEETREEIEYLKSIGEYDDYKKMIRALKAHNASAAEKKAAKKPANKPAKKASEMKRSFVYTINASGYYKSYHFSTKKECLEEMKKDAEATALDYDGELNWHDEYECEVVDKEGQRIAAFCYVGTWNR